MRGCRFLFSFLLILTLGARAEEVKIPAAEGAMLAGTFQLPAGPHQAPFPAVVLVHGSGRVTRYQLQWMAGRYLDQGIAVLSYDKRGVGESGGQYANIGPRNSIEMFGLLAGDALAGVSYLRSRRDIDPARIGLSGVSQAGWIIPYAATRPNAAVRWIVIISGPATSVGEEIAYSRWAGEDPSSEKGLSDAEIEQRMRQWKGPAGYDPLATLEKLTTPSLWIQGEKDRSIPQPKTLAVLERLRKSGLPYTVVVLPNGNHGLRDLVTGAPIPYWNRVEEWLRVRGVTKGK